MKAKLFTLFTFSIILLGLSACCGNSDDIVELPTVEFKLVNSAGMGYYGDNGLLAGTEPKIFQDDKQTEIDIFVSAPDGFISFFIDRSYGQITATSASRIYFLEVNEGEFDELIATSTISEGRCSTSESIDNLIFNGTTFFNGADILK